MSWIKDTELRVLEKLLVNIVKAGKVPRHIAFVMDGNRRFADKIKVTKSQGHLKGFNKLTEVLQWCYNLDVKAVTVYAFSLENFKRSEKEVNDLMEIAREKFKNLLEEKDKLLKGGVNIRIIGDLSVVPEDIVKLMAEAVFITRENKKHILTVAFAYTAQNEVAESVRCISKGVLNGILQEEDITSTLIEKSLHTEDNDAPDLVIRTSGEVRLSDFMLWQSSCSCIYFTPVLWPEFTLWEFLKAIFHYQRSYDTLIKVRRKECDFVENERVKKFLGDLYHHRFEKLKANLS